jgi:GntR family transcriptional regulator
MIDFAPRSVLAPSEVERGFRGSMLDLLRGKKDLQIAHALTEITATAADRLLVAKLQISENQPLLLLKEVLLGTKGTVLLLSRKYCVPGFFHFHLVRR